jgi:hypothetical protein
MKPHIWKVEYEVRKNMLHGEPFPAYEYLRVTDLFATNGASLSELETIIRAEMTPSERFEQVHAVTYVGELKNIDL